MKQPILNRLHHLNSVSRSKFIVHFTRNVIFGLIFIGLTLFIGMLGYHIFENMSWVDSFVNASMILSGMGPLLQLTTTAGKIFAGFYALFSGLAFIAIIALIFAPIVHRFFRRIHLENNKLS
jgi:uncharacterized membrane protein YcgQ (UPF0703/DUF1980 family)